MSRPAWLIIEPRFDGHHWTYLERIVEGAIARDVRVLVGIGDDAQADKLRAALARRFGERVEIVAAPLPRPSRLRGPVRIAADERRQRRFFGALLDAATRIAPVDFVFVAYLDLALFAIAAQGSPFGAVPFSGITMRQRFHFPARGVKGAADRLAAAKGALFRRLLRLPTLRNVFVIDETLAEHVRAIGTAGADKVVYVPDPSDPAPLMDRAVARDRLGLPAAACVVLIFGFLDPRKGVERLLEWVGHPGAPASSVLIAAGGQSEDARRLFAAPAARALVAAGRLRVTDRFVSEEEVAVMFAAADLIWLGYERFDMMSGVLVKAAQQHRAVVYADYGLIGRFAERHGQPSSTEGRCDALTALLPPGLHVRYFEGRGPLPLADHSWANALRLMLG